MLTLPVNRDPITSVSFRPNPDTVRYSIRAEQREPFLKESDFLTVASSGWLRTFAVPSGQRLGAYECPSEPTSVAHSPVGTPIAAGCEDGSVRVYRGDTGGLLRTIPAYSGPIASVAYDRKGKRIVTASAREGVKVFDVTSGEVTMPDITSGNRFVSARFDALGVRLITAEVSNPFYGEGAPAAKVWNAVTGQMIEALRASGGDGVVSAAFAPGGTDAITSDRDGNVRLWSVVPDLVSRGRLTARTAPSMSAEPGRDASRLLAATQLPRGSYAVLYDRSKREPVYLGDDRWVTGVTWHPDGVHAAVGNARGEISFFNTETRESLGRWEVVDTSVYQLQFSRDGRRLALLGENIAAAIVWNVETEEEQCLVVHGEVPLQSVAFNGDGSLLATSSGVDRSTRIWDSETGDSLRVIEWEAMDGYTNWPVPVDAAAFNGDRLILAQFVDHLREVSVESGETFRTFAHQESEILCVDISPDRARVATGAMDGSARIYQVDTGAVTVVSRGFETPVSSVRFSDDGETLLVGSFWASMFQTIPVSPVERAMAVAPRGLTPDERDRFQIGSAEERAEYRSEWEREEGDDS